jgi:hypothetical protein
MAEYQVKYKIKVPKSRNPQSGKITYQNSGYVNSTIKVQASSPEEARKVATKSDAVSKAKARAARNLDYDMPKPRVQITEVSRASSKLSGKGGGGMMSPVKTPADSSRMSMPLKKKMNRGGVVKKVRK